MVLECNITVCLNFWEATVCHPNSPRVVQFISPTVYGGYMDWGGCKKYGMIQPATSHRVLFKRYVKTRDMQNPFAISRRVC